MKVPRAGIVVSAALGLSAALLVSACGQKGPLYLPDQPKGATWPYPPAPTPTPAPAKVPDVPATSDEKK
jgi:predicted small lipoprotein YifL